MSEESPIQLPNAMRWRFKTKRKRLKETVPMTPNNGTTTIRENRGFTLGLFNANDTFNDVLRDRQEY
jgi:hypothetical protein